MDKEVIEALDSAMHAAKGFGALHIVSDLEIIRAYLTDPGYRRVPVHVKRDGNDIRLAHGDLNSDGSIKLGDVKAISVWVGPEPSEPEMKMLRVIGEAMLSARQGEG